MENSGPHISPQFGRTMQAAAPWPPLALSGQAKSRKLFKISLSETAGDPIGFANESSFPSEIDRHFLLYSF